MEDLKMEDSGLKINFINGFIEEVAWVEGNVVYTLEKDEKNKPVLKKTITNKPPKSKE